MEKKVPMGRGKLNLLRLLPTDVSSAVSAPVDSGRDDSNVQCTIDPEFRLPARSEILFSCN